MSCFSGCVSHTAGSPAHLPNNIHTLAVPVFRNATQSHHTAVAFTQPLIKEFSNGTPAGGDVQQVLKPEPGRGASFPEGSPSPAQKRDLLRRILVYI